MHETATVTLEAEEAPLPGPGNVTFEDFDAEYSRVMEAVAWKERKGGLDPDHPETYRPMTDEERKLMAEDWKAFSRLRGFSEEDITEYERWLTLSGQADGLPDAVNDPWRQRMSYPSGWSKYLYLRHVENQRLNHPGEELSPEVQASYDRIRQEIDLAPSLSHISTSDVVDPVPAPPPDAEDVW